MSVYACIAESIAVFKVRRVFQCIIFSSVFSVMIISHLVLDVLCAVTLGQIEAPEMVPRITAEGKGRRNEESVGEGRRKEESMGESIGSSVNKPRVHT